jgi:CPA1 family monovalent cation:H+ antiporter
VLGLLVVVTGLAMLARAIAVPYPILLVVGGLAIGLVPGLPHVELEPDLAFLLFLPPLLFVAAFFASPRDLKANLRPIGLLAVGLVLFTTAVVGIVAHALMPEIGWPVAFTLGAIVSPPDAVAASAIFHRLGVPSRIMTVLEGESLVNDATGLIAYRAAVSAAVTGSFSFAEWSLLFVVVALGGVLIGVAVGLAVAQLWRRVHDPVSSITISLLAPYAAYLPAEHLGVSGVLAAVTAGLYLGWAWPRALTGEAASETRLQGRAVWGTFEFILNGLVFVLIGLQLPTILENLGRPLGELFGIGVLISLAVIGSRIVWVFPSTYLPRWLSASLRRRDPSPPWQWTLMLSWSGMRGVVSLAAALALPVFVANGDPFPGRDLMIFLTFAVILATLVGQGLTLPPLIRLLGLSADGSEEREEMFARSATAEAALARIDDLEQAWPDHRELIDQLRARYEHRARHVQMLDADTSGPSPNAEWFEHREIFRAVINAEREAVIGLHDDGAITDSVLYRIQRDLDLAEVRMEA